MWVPPAAVNAERERQVDERIGAAFAFADRLKQIDEKLELVKASDGSDDPQIVSGYWHVRRRNFPEADSYMPITTPTGGYAEPSEWHLDLLRERDLWQSGVESIYARVRARERAREKQEADQKAERVDELSGRITGLKGIVVP